MFDLPSMLDILPELDVLVVGDVTLDCWLAGSVRRISREAPVPVLTVSGRTTMPGGAGNVAANAVALGARVRLVGTVGDDGDGSLLRSALATTGVDDQHVLTVPGRQTLSKRRLLAGAHMVARLDDGATEPVPAATEARLIELIDELAPSCRALLVCDHGAGTLTDAVRDELARLRRSLRAVVAVDAHQLARWRDLRPTAVTPDFAEALRLLGMTPSLFRLSEGDESRAAFSERRAGTLLEASGASMVVTTLDRDGAVMLQPGRRVYRAAPHAVVPVEHATGAGDTLFAAFALALAAGAPESSALEVATLAAGVSVARPGTGVCGREDLLRAASSRGPAPLRPAELATLARSHRAAGRRVVLAHGRFGTIDHECVHALTEASRLGDVLVVALTEGEPEQDETGSLTATEPPSACPRDDRAVVLAALGCVDHVVVVACARGLAELRASVQPQVCVPIGAEEAGPPELVGPRAAEAAELVEEHDHDWSETQRRHAPSPSTP